MSNMKSNIKPLIKVRVQYELAYEIIFNSLIIIFVGAAYLFASNLLNFNWYTILFGLTAILLIYFKFESYLQIENDELTITYCKYIKSLQLDLKTISEIVFYSNKRQVEIKSNGNVVKIIYLNRKMKEKLLNYIVNHYPNIPCIYID